MLDHRRDPGPREEPGAGHAEPGGTSRDFTAEIDRYVVLKLDLSAYRGSGRLPPPGCRLADPERGRSVARAERRLLRRNFRHWKAAFRGRLRGWRPDSRLLVLREERLVAGVYLVAANEFDDDPRWGQLHYAFVDPACKGQGLYSHLFGAAVERARSWGLVGLYLNSDRHLLPEVYQRWGAVPWRTLPKQPERLSWLGRLRARLGL
ncbi:MAG TPA: GNAT family N-acetyltransferase [Planctomycetota bacterium]